MSASSTVFSWYHSRLLQAKARVALAALLLIGLGMAAPGLLDQYSQTSRLRSLLAGRNTDERSVFFDNPGFQAAQGIKQAVPADGCVAVLAYAGPAATEYYRARFRYLLYPRRVRLFDSTAATVGDCGHLAVFRDSQRNLSQEPFAGSWSEQELDQRLQALHRVAVGEVVDVYQVR